MCIDRRWIAEDLDDKKVRCVCVLVGISVARSQTHGMHLQIYRKSFGIKQGDLFANLEEVRSHLSALLVSALHRS